jgi:hypothetical protein
MVKMAMVLLAVFSLIITANAGYVSSNLKSQKTTQMMNTPTVFYANITLNLYKGEVCDQGCVPLRGVTIYANSTDIEHDNISGVTDYNGKCVLQHRYTKYQISINETDHESVLFEFEIIGDQVLKFQIKKIETSSNRFSSIQIMLQKIIFAKKLIT